MIRAFIAVEIPAPVRAALAEVQAGMMRADVGVKVSWTRIANVHLTLQFLGDIPDHLAPAISLALTAVAGQHASFDLPVGGVGAFPNVRVPRVLWVGCRDEAGKLKSLAAAIQARMQEFGFTPEQRDFAAHLTLGRIKVPRADAALTKLLGSLTDCRCATMHVDAVHLFQSRLHPQGSIYTKLSSHVLKGD